MLHVFVLICGGIVELSIDAGLPETRGGKFMRPVGYMGRLFHRYSREHPRHFCIVAENSGDMDTPDFQTVFDKMQRRHPMLPAYIAADARPGPSIYHSNRKSPITVTTSVTPEDSRAIVEREPRLPFVDSEAPLICATMLRTSEQATVVLTLHHALPDGLLATVIVGDLLVALNGRELELMPMRSSLDQSVEKALLPPSKAIRASPPEGLDADALHVIARMPLWWPFESDRPIVSTVSFSTAETKSIKHRSNDESKTVHGAICTALARDTPKVPKEKFIIMSSVNPNDTLANVEAHAGLLVCGVTIKLIAPFDRGFWDIAHQVTDGMVDARTNDGILRGITSVDGCLPADADTEIACGAMGALAYNAVVTNLGVIALPNEIGGLRPDPFRGPSLQGRFSNEIVIGTASLNKQLRLIQTGPALIEPLVESLRADLLDACRDEN